MDISTRVNERKSFIGACIGATIATIALFLRNDLIGMIIGLTIVFIILISIGLILFIPSRNDKPSLEHGIKHSNTVWGLWFTGETIYNEKFYKKYKSIKRILLMRPDSEAFNQNLKIANVSPDESREQILRLTKEAKNQGIDVRWYSKFNNIGLTLFDRNNGNKPDSSKAWCLVSVLKDSAPADKRDMYLKKNINNNSYYKSMLQKFEDIWDNEEFSQEPKPYEYGAINGEKENKTT